MEEKIRALQKKLESAKGIERVDILTELGEVLYKREPDQARPCLQEALEIAAEEQYERGLGNSYNWLAEIAGQTGDQEEAVKLHTKALEARLAAGEEQAIAMSYRMLSMRNTNLGNLEEALRYANLALELAAPDNYYLLAKIHSALGNINYYFGDYETAIEHQFEVVTYYTQLGDLDGQGTAMHNIGMIYKVVEKQEQAITYLLKAIELKKEADLKVDAVWSEALLARIYTDLDDLEQAEKTIQSAYDTVTKSDSEYLLTMVFEAMTDLKLKQGEYDEAIRIGRKALEINVRRKSFFTDAINSHIRLGQAFLSKGDWDQAEQHLLEGLNLSQKGETAFSELACYEALVELMAVQNRGAEALTYFKKFVELKDKKSSEKFSKQLASMQSRFETEQAQQQAEIERLRNVELLAAKDAAEAANRAKSAFLANMSHELRTPLNAILGFTNLLRRQPEAQPDEVEKLDIVHRSGEHLLSLINAVLDLSKIEAGRYQLEEVDFDLNHLLDDLEAMFRLRADTKGLDLAFERDHEILTYIHADNLKLRQVLINLLGNAVKFTEQGSIRCQVSRDEVEDRLRFSISDTGPGIAADELASLFEAFTQTQVGRASQKGTGLGLAISQQFVQLMGGELSVESEVGKGSTFSFSIPIRIAESEIDTTERTAIRLAPDQPIYRMLVVDDDEINRRLLVELLHPFGFELREAENGAEAVKEFETWNPHLIWMDMRMPVMDGYAATKEIKSGPTGNEIPIIAVTASTYEGARGQVLAAGCEDLIRKPFREGQIFHMLEKHLGVEFIYQDLEPPPPAVSKSFVKQQISLPAELHQNLLTALEYHSPQLIEASISALESDYPELATYLHKLANEFEYDQMKTLIEASISDD